MCDWADTVNSQMIDGVKMTMIEACKALELETVASMPFAMGDGFKKYAREFDTSKLKRILQSLETGLFFCQIFVFII